MKIEAIERFPIAIKPAKAAGPAANRRSGTTAVHTVIIRIKTDSGISGLGEAASIPPYCNPSTAMLLAWLKTCEAALVGASALNINGVHRLLDGVSGAFAPGCQPARAAIDMAIHDIIGKARGCPVHALLGGAYRGEFELLADLCAKTPAQQAATARRLVTRGIRALKVNIGVSPGQDFEAGKKKLLAVLDAVDSAIYIDADAEQSWANPGTVSSFFEKLLAGHFYANLALGQPLHYLDLKGHAQLREQLAIPLILDESLVSPEAMIQIVRLGAADRVVLQIGRVGGLQNAMRIADICEAAAIGITPAALPNAGLIDTAHCHLAAALRDPYPLNISVNISRGHSRSAKTPVSGGFAIERGRAILGNTPGLGVELDEALLHSMTIRT